MSDKMNPKSIQYWKEGPGNSMLGSGEATKEFVDSCGPAVVQYISQRGGYNQLPSNAEPEVTDSDTIKLLESIAGVGPKSAQKLFDAGYTAVDQVLASSHDELIEAGLSAANISLILEEDKD